MGVTTRFWDNVEYHADDVVTAFNELMANGVGWQQCRPTATDPEGMFVRALGGRLWIRGRPLIIEPDLTDDVQPVEPHAGDGSRWDRLIAYTDTGEQGGGLYVKQGTTAAPPDVTRTATRYELSLCRFPVTSSTTKIVDRAPSGSSESRIVDERGDSYLCPWWRPFAHAWAHAPGGPDPMAHGAGSGLDADLLRGHPGINFLHLGNVGDNRNWQLRFGTQAVRTNSLGTWYINFNPPFANECRMVVVTHGNVNSVDAIVGVDDTPDRGGIHGRSKRPDGTPYANTMLRINYIAGGY